jgi:hypothetical protein
MSAASQYAEDMERLWERVLEIALDEVGPKEGDGNNRGECEKYLRPLGLPPGSPYCVAGIRWCFSEACAELGIQNPIFKTGGVVKLWKGTPSWMRATQLSMGPAIGLHRSSKDPTKGHVAIVLPWDGEKPAVASTLEFNSNAAGSRDGDGVILGRRPWAYFDIGYIDPRGFKLEDRACRS